MKHYLLDYHTWLSVFITAPIVWSLIYALLLWIGHQYKAWRLWYFGLALHEYLSMAFLLAGVRGLRGKRCHKTKFNGRLWFSPDVKSFKLDDVLEDEA